MQIITTVSEDLSDEEESEVEHSEGVSLPIAGQQAEILNYPPESSAPNKALPDKDDHPTFIHYKNLVNTLDVKLTPLQLHRGEEICLWVGELLEFIELVEERVDEANVKIAEDDPIKMNGTLAKTYLGNLKAKLLEAVHPDPKTYINRCVKVLKDEIVESKLQCLENIPQEDSRSFLQKIEDLFTHFKSFLTYSYSPRFLASPRSLNNTLITAVNCADEGVKDILENIKESGEVQMKQG